MPPRRKSRRHHPAPDAEEEVFDVVELEDSDQDVVEASSSRDNLTPSNANAGNAPPAAVIDLTDRSGGGSATPSLMEDGSLHPGGKASSREAASDEAEEDDKDMEEVEVPRDGDEEDDMDMEEVQVPQEAGEQDEAVDLGFYYGINEDHNAEKSDEEGEGGRDDARGEGTSLEKGAIEITIEKAKKVEGSQKKKINTAFERTVRLETHKLHAVALLANARIRNRWINDETLRTRLRNMVPAHLHHAFAAIHPKKEPNKRERVRMFEAAMKKLVAWWVDSFYLDGPSIRQSAMLDLRIAAWREARRGKGKGPSSFEVNGWQILDEKEALAIKEREGRERRAAIRKLQRKQERQANDIKGKAKAIDVDAYDSSSSELPQPSIIVPLLDPNEPGELVYLRCLPPPEPLTSPASFLEYIDPLHGSRDLSAQLFTALCRALDIPARLVTSLQPVPWSVGAAKLGGATGSTSKTKKSLSLEKRKPIDEMTSDEEDDDMEEVDVTPKSSKSMSTESTPRRLAQVAKAGASSSPASARGSSSKPIDLVSGNTSTAEASGPEMARGEESRTLPASRSSRPRRRGQANESSSAKGRGKGTSSNSNSPGAFLIEDGEVDEDMVNDQPEDNDYRPEKWRGLKHAIPVKPTVKLRKQKIGTVVRQTLVSTDKSQPPVFWTEVYSRPFARWLSVDPIRAKVNIYDHRNMEPASSNWDNTMVYVVALEEDGYARDVTARYARHFGSKTSRLRVPARRGEDWWADVMRPLTRPMRLQRDAAEDAELAQTQHNEPMPTSVAGFKDHPLYVLERQLRREETIFPRTEIGKFNGEPVFPRQNVVQLKTSENWMREGRKIKAKENPLKWVKARVVTLEKRRAQEAAQAEGRELEQQALYAVWQTELYSAPPVVNGKIPKNSYGNVDLFVPTMLSPGAVHIPFKGVAKVAKQLGVDFGEAVTGFEFKKRRAIPIVTGIVIAKENEDMVVDAFWASEHAAAERAFTKRQERALKRWKKLIVGLRVVERIRKEYRDKGDDAGSFEIVLKNGTAELGSRGAEASGGFLAEDDDNVAAALNLPSVKGRLQPKKRDDSDSSSDAESHTGGVLAAKNGDDGGRSAETEEQHLPSELDGKTERRGKVTIKSLGEMAAEERGPDQSIENADARSEARSDVSTSMSLSTATGKRKRPATSLAVSTPASEKRGGVRGDRASSAPSPNARTRTKRPRAATSTPQSGTGTVGTRRSSRLTARSEEEQRRRDEEIRKALASEDEDDEDAEMEEVDA